MVLDLLKLEGAMLEETKRNHIASTWLQQEQLLCFLVQM